MQWFRSRSQVSYCDVDVSVRRPGYLQYLNAMQFVHFCDFKPNLVRRARGDRLARDSRVWPIRGQPLNDFLHGFAHGQPCCVLTGFLRSCHGPIFACAHRNI